MGLGQVYVLGASMGGMIAQILAARYPDKVKKWAYCLPVITSHCYPAFSKATFSLIDKPASTDEDGIVDHSLKLFNIIGSPGYVNHLEAIQTARKLYKRSYHPAGVLQQF